MQLQLPSRLCTDVADSIVGARSLDDAYYALSGAIFNNFICESLIFARRGGAWVRVAGRVSVARERAWREGLDQLAGETPIVIRIETPAEGVATVIKVAHHEPLAIVLEEDWTASGDLLSACAGVIGISLYAVEQRDATRRVGRVIRSIYRIARRAGAKADGMLAKKIVDQLAVAFSAERVSIALFDSGDNCLRIKASHGTPLSIAQDIKIRPGDWILGHVFTTGKAVTVNDARALPSTHSHQNRYRSQSFVVVPLIHQARTLGVLSITDKRDGSPFGAAEQIAMKTVASVIATALNAERAEADVERLEHAASVDSLTGLLNRSYLDSRLQQEVSRSEREGTQLAVLMADIDAFKSINDTRGHQAGDAVLRQVGDIIRSAVRVFDVCARWGGDEFAILMPRCDHASAMACAERIRRRTAEALKDSHDGRTGVTVSVGVVVGEPGDTAVELIARADRALYDAKSGGRDLVRMDPTLLGQRDDALEAQLPSLRQQAEAGGPPLAQLPYILIADASSERADVYRQTADEFRLGLLKVTTGEQAARAMGQFGPPVLLAVDMTDKQMRGVSLVEAAHAGIHPTFVVAFSPSREFREYASTKPAGLSLDVLRPEVPPERLKTVLDRNLRLRESGVASASKRENQRAADQRRAVAELTRATLELIPVPGVAVYLKDPGDAQLRSTVTWRSEVKMARAHHHMPQVIEQVLSTGAPIMVGAVGAAREGSVENGYGLMAAPVRLNGEVIGAVCAFADTPLAVAADTLSRLDRLAETVFNPQLAPALPAPAPPPAPVVREDRRARSSRPAEPREGARPEHGAADGPWEPTLLERQRGEFEVARELARARREQRELSIVLFEISQAREQAGGTDTQLFDGVAETLVRVIRQSDLPIRWSGNELLLVLPGLPGAEARTVAERVRAAMQAGGRHRVAVSGGVAELETDEQFSTVVSRARAKVAMARGRGRVS